MSSNGIWMVRAGRDAMHLETFVSKGLVAIGLSSRIGEEALNLTRKKLTVSLSQAHPDKSKYWASTQAGQLYRFVNEVKVGHPVVTYDSNQRIYLLGKVSSETRYEPGTVPYQPYVRTVAWEGQIPRDAISVSTRNSLGAIQTLFRLNTEASEELAALAKPLGVAEEPVLDEDSGVSDEAPDELGDLLAETEDKSRVFIEDMLARLSWEQMEHLIAGILRSMGYKARVSPKGADRGVDVFASPDGLGLEEPRIFVEVKHRQAAMGAQAIRAFLGGRQVGDRCLFVSTGGFTKDARYEADRSSIPIRLLALPDLRELLLEHYDGLEPEAKRLVPLKRLYWPIGHP